jgi:hypothetical protein
MLLLLMPEEGFGKVVIVAGEVVVDVWDIGKVYMGSEVVG